MVNMSIRPLFEANFLRKFRWRVTVNEGDQALSQEIEKYAITFGRPSITFDEQEINYRNEKMWIAGKGTWDTLNMTLLDVGTSDPIYGWLRAVYDFQNEQGPMGKDTTAGAQGGGDCEPYKKDLKLDMLDGCGNVVESWLLERAWPSTINWGDLDYSDNAVANIEMTIRFDRAQRTSGAAAQGGQAGGGN